MTTFAEGKARNLALNSQGTIVSTLDGANPSIYGERPEYIPINIGNSVSLDETVRLTVSFDLVMTVATANPALQVYNSNNKGPMQLANVNALAGETHAVGETISKRVAVTANWAPRSDANKQTNWLEFYSTYGTGNYFSISNLMVELGEVAHPWRAAPEDLEGASDMILATDTKTLAVAVDVQQVDTYYYQTASTGTAPSKPTAASPSGWQTAEYAFDASKAVWSCQKTTLTDGTFYWGAVSKWSAYEGSVVAWNKANAAQSAAAEAAKVAGNYIVETATNDVWVHSENHGPNSSGVATADTYGWRIGSVFELVRAGLSYFKMWVENSVAKVRVGLENAGHSVFSPSGMEVFTDSTTSVARFGSTARIGNENSTRLLADERSLNLLNYVGEAVFLVENHDTSGLEYTTWGTRVPLNAAQMDFAFVDDSDGRPFVVYFKVQHYQYNSQLDTLIPTYSETLPFTVKHEGSNYVLSVTDRVIVGPADVTIGYRYTEADVFVQIGSNSSGNIKITQDGLSMNFYDAADESSISFDSAMADFDALDIVTAGNLTAANIGAKQSDESSSSTSLSSGSTKAVASVSLAAGTWVVVGHAVFASNSSGVRSLGIGSTANSLSYTDLSTVTVNATDGADTRLQSTSIVSPTSTTTYYLNAYQNSGSARNCTSAKLTAIRIK